MAYRFHGRATVNSESPGAFARCDRCGFWYNHKALQFQFDFRGPRLTNLKILVCSKCYDKPQPQLKPIMTTQDPLPVVNARPEDLDYVNNDYRVAEGAVDGGKFLILNNGSGFTGVGTINGTVLTISSTTSGTLSVNDTISGIGVYGGTTIVSLGTGSGGIGTYNISLSQAVIIPTTITTPATGSARVVQEAGPYPLDGFLVPTE
jgi:hypothetical protein